jgi:hypothetical protein
MVPTPSFIPLLPPPRVLVQPTRITAAITIAETFCRASSFPLKKWVVQTIAAAIMRPACLRIGGLSGKIMVKNL